MAFEIPIDLNPALTGLAWLIGSWRGNGHGNWPGRGGFEFGQQIDFATNGTAVLHYLSQSYTLDADGQPATPLSMETGFWRPADDASLEVVLAQPDGLAEVWIGKISGAKIELTTDVVARTQTAPEEVTGGQRLYGNVEGDLLWSWDRATTQVPLQAYMWARLKRA